MHADEHTDRQADIMNLMIFSSILRMRLRMFQLQVAWMQQWHAESENIHKRNQFCAQYLSQTCITNNRTCTHCHNTDSRRRIYPQRLKPYPTSQEIPCLFRHSKDQYCVYNSLPLNSTPSQWTAVHTHTHTHTQSPLNVAVKRVSHLPRITEILGPDPTPATGYST